MAEEKKPVSREPVNGFDLARYVDVAARLAEHVQPRDEILAASGLDELGFLEIEKTWLLRVAHAAMDGDLDLPREYEARWIAAQDALGPTEPTHGIDVLAAIVSALSRGEDARDVLPRHLLTLPGFARLQRAWARRMAKDEALAETYEDLLQHARR